MDFKAKWSSNQIRCQRLLFEWVTFVFILLQMVVVASESEHYTQQFKNRMRFPQHQRRPTHQEQGPPLYYHDEESDFHYENDEYGGEGYGDGDGDGVDYMYSEAAPFPYHNEKSNYEMVDKHMLGYYNLNKKKKPWFSPVGSGGYDYSPPPPPPIPYYDESYYPPPYDPDPYLPPSGPELPSIYPLPPGAVEPPYPPPPFSSPDPGFKTQTGFEGFLVPNSWYGLLPWGIEGVIIVIAGIIIFVIIVIAIISVIAWLCGVRKVVPNIVHSLKNNELEIESRMFDAWSPKLENQTTQLLRLSEQVLNSIEKYEFDRTEIETMMMKRKSKIKSKTT